METGPIPVSQIPARQRQRVVHPAGGGRELERPLQRPGGGRRIPGIECHPAEAVVGGRLLRVEGKSFSPECLRCRRPTEPVFHFRQAEQHRHPVRRGFERGPVSPRRGLQVAPGVQRESLEVEPSPVARVDSLRFAVAGERVLEQVQGFGLKELQSVVEAAEFTDRGRQLPRGGAFRVESPDRLLVPGDLHPERLVGRGEVGDRQLRCGTVVSGTAESGRGEEDRGERGAAVVAHGAFPSPRRRVW